MARVFYIGDEVTAAGYRLAGAEARVPVPSETGEVFRRACSDGADVILLSAALAPEIDPGELSAALIAEAPLVAIVPDAFGRCPPPDVARDVRLALGIES
jgi:vacuolar-type H+-ATPase subunit F/Vma7